MKLELPSEFVLYDTEYTSWEGAQERDWSGPNEYREILQVGAIKVGDTFQELDSFLVYVKPVKNPVLSDFIKQLTGITQQQVDEKGIDLGSALSQFISFVGTLPCYAYGRDAEVIEKNCKLIDVAFPFDRSHLHNLRPMVAPLLLERNIDPAQYSSGTLLEAFGKKGARAHDAVNDMRNLLVALRELR